MQRKVKLIYTLLLFLWAVCILPQQSLAEAKQYVDGLVPTKPPEEELYVEEPEEAGLTLPPLPLHARWVEPAEPSEEGISAFAAKGLALQWAQDNGLLKWREIRQVKVREQYAVLDYLNAERPSPFWYIKIYRKNDPPISLSVDAVNGKLPLQTDQAVLAKAEEFFLQLRIEKAEITGWQKQALYVPQKGEWIVIFTGLPTGNSYMSLSDEDLSLLAIQ